VGILHPLVKKVSQMGSIVFSQESSGRISSMFRTCSEEVYQGNSDKVPQNGADASLFYLDY